jgi:hypothetical protein
MIVACNNSDTVRPARLTENQLFRYYVINAEEEKEYVTGVAYFHRNIDQKPVRLEEPAKVELDGTELSADSASGTGTFYEFQEPLEEFEGRHTLTYVNNAGAEVKDVFQFRRFELSGDFDNVVKRSELILLFEGLKEGEWVRIVMTDTSSGSTGLNRKFSIRKSSVDLRQEINNVVNGPVLLQVSREEDQLLNESGRISMTYSLKREFILKD